MRVIAKNIVAVSCAALLATGAPAHAAAQRHAAAPVHAAGHPAQAPAHHAAPAPAHERAHAAPHAHAAPQPHGQRRQHEELAPAPAVSRIHGGRGSREPQLSHAELLRKPLSAHDRLAIASGRMPAGRTLAGRQADRFAAPEPQPHHLTRAYSTRTPEPATPGRRLLAEAPPLPQPTPTQTNIQPNSQPSPQPEPLVHHDRKIHLSAEPTPSASLNRKATTADFLTASAAPAPALPTLSGKPAPIVRITPTPPPAAAIPTASMGARSVVMLAPEMPEPLLAPHELVRDPAPIEPEPVIFDNHGKLIMPAALKGSHENLLHQNAVADADGLARVQDDDDLDRMRRAGSLVAIPAVQGLRSDDRLPLNRRFCRPWTAQFLEAVARAHYRRFGTTLQVNSAVRTVEFQQRLMHTNGNAAPAEGETASPHLTGQAVDLAKRGLTNAEIAWMRAYLLPLAEAGRIDVEEEFQQSCFHISVYRRYAPAPAAAPSHRGVYTAHHGADTVLADTLVMQP